jgi:hypothetical protein
MANTIRIKRSAATNEPGTALLQGELGNSEAGSPNGLNEFWIGITGSTNFKLIRNLNAAPAEPTAGLAAATPITSDYAIFEDVTDSMGKRVLFSAMPLSIFSNDSNWNNYVHPNHSGHVTSVADGAQTVVVAAITGQTELASGLAGTDELLVNDGGVIKRMDISVMNAYFNAALSFGTVTSVGAGNGMDFTAITTTGNVVLGTPSANLSGASTNAVAATSHTHAIDTSGTGDIMAVNGATLTGPLNCADQDLNRPVLEDYGVKHTAPTVSANAVTLNCAVSNSFLVDMDPATAAVVVTLSNPPASGTYGEMNIAIVMGTPAYGITWPGSVVWQGGTAPNLTTVNNNVDLVHLFTVDGGTTWYGTFSISDATAGGGTVTAVTGGLGITSTGGTTPDIALALSELTAVAAAGADYFAITDTTDTNISKKALISTTEVGLFANVTTEYVSENDTLVVADWNWVLDQDTMSSNSAVHLPTQQSVKAYVDTEVAAAVASEMTYKGGYNAATNVPALDTGSPVLAVGDMYVVTTAGTFFALPVVAGDTLIANTASVDAAAFADWDIVEGLQTVPDASETEKGIIEIATQAEVDTLTGGSALLVVTPAYMHLTTFDGGTF